MTNSTNALFGSEPHTNWVRLRTFSFLRWVAIGGQIAAISIATIYFDLAFELGWVCVVIGASVIANLVAIFIYPENKRLTQAQAARMLLFDTAQLAALLYLTGGLNNPFALLIVAPVTISATALHLRSTIALGLVAVILTSLLAKYHIPLQTVGGDVLRMPVIFVFGFWLAILIGTVFLGIYARRVTSEIHSMSQALLATQMALSREQKLTDLGGVVAAAAHELGTPLATIKLASAELIEELANHPDLKEDAALIRDQADRCREILRSMGRAGKDDLQIKQAPLIAVVEEAADPHLNRGITVHFDFDESAPDQPEIRRAPEIIHGLRNLIQNAVDFARANVWIEARWTTGKMLVRVLDDGPGYPSDLLGRIGDPFLRRRRRSDAAVRRAEYEGMGLGLFIAKTLLERSGADVSFTNGRDPFLEAEDDLQKCGAIVEVTWARASAHQSREPLGRNEQIT